MEAAPEREYEVIFFKRKNKVHKSKGVSKVDGRLVIHAGCAKLYEGDNTKQPIHSSKNSEIAKRAFQVDEEVTLAQYTVEIVSIVSIVSSSDSAAQAMQKAVTMHTKPTTTLIRKPLAAMKINRKLLTTAKPTALFNKKTVTSTWQQNRRPPAQPKQGTIESSDDDDDEATSQLQLVSQRTAPPTKSTFLSGRKRKLVPATRSPAPPPLTMTTVTTATATSSLAGAIGTLVLPPSIRSVMRPHQQSGVVYLWNCLTGASVHLQRVAAQAGVQQPTPKGAILADSMGMGKTLMTIAIVSALYRRNKQHRFIIVCPSSLVQNWAKEFDKWLGRASQPKRVIVKKGGPDGLRTIRGFAPIKPNQSEILIISYDLFRMNANLLTEAKQIGLLVVDEGHRLKNSSGSVTISALNALDCDARLLITGTPVQNNLSEFHTVANFVCPGVLGSLADFRRDFERPITAANRKDASSQQRQNGEEQSHALDDIIKAFLLRRLAKDVLTDLLPPRMELLLFCRPSSVQCDLYRQMTQQISNPLSTLTNLRKLCSHPDLLNDKKKASLSNGGIAASGKLHILEKLLDEVRKTSPDDKVVLVSCFTSILSMIEQKLIKPKGWTYKRLDGSTTQSDRQPLVDSFNRTSAEQSFIFLLSSKAGGMGLNLVGANRLIMFDADYNPAVDAQAMARIYRPGQTKPTTIYRIFTAGTMEESIYQRQQHKGNLATTTVDGSTNADSGKFTDEELRDCFTLKEDTRCDTKNKMKALWPEYSGSDSLLSQGCSDQAVLNLVDDTSDILRYVHIVPVERSNAADEEGEDANATLHPEGASVYQDESELPMESSDDEEYEFDD